MALIELQTDSFRNLNPERLRFSPRVNLIHGVNGSGKTSLLEAIHVLSTGRSFRTHKPENLVTIGQECFTLFGIVRHDAREHRLGFSRDIKRKETILKQDGERIRSLATMARELPVSVIEPGTFDIIAGGPGKRRQFLDWLVFHVEHPFAGVWQRCQKSLTQRNHLLRNGTIGNSQMSVWDRQFAELATHVTQYRKQCFEEFVPLLQGLLNTVSAPWAGQVSLSFNQGWAANRLLEEVLTESLVQECRMGHTLHGPHRADIQIRVAGRRASEVLSRGQQKTLVVLMKLAQMAMVNRHSHRHGICLLDDINAELDGSNQDLLAQQLLQLGSQVFVTSIERPDPAQLWHQAMNDLAMFHVEHGAFTKEQQALQEP
ncbi:MAG: DNA replication/repair protein RecF [Halomonadaceae bacterium]|nr:MAG: DNA replication/repair protein RecF [Halomonadaceae bacterium]